MAKILQLRIYIYFYRKDVYPMRKLYLLICFTGFTFLASAQDAKRSEISTTSEVVKVIRFFPNPATTVINFELTKNQKEATLQVYNFVGKMVYELYNINQKTALPLSDFFRGVYIFQLRD